MHVKNKSKTTRAEEKKRRGKEEKEDREREESKIYDCTIWKKSVLVLLFLALSKYQKYRPKSTSISIYLYFRTFSCIVYISVVTFTKKKLILQAFYSSVLVFFHTHIRFNFVSARKKQVKYILFRRSRN